ncbi:MAG TPA: DUF6252 family protein [Flavobacterium sp.]|nr:DUF6252 family protein [Flavobacterium sp.]
MFENLKSTLLKHYHKIISDCYFTTRKDSCGSGGEYGMESLSLKIPSVTPGTYYFGVDSNTVAYYRSEAPDGLVLEYSTIEGPENENEGNLGELTIYEITDPKASPVQGTISGEFKFRGRIMNNNPFGQPSVFFHKGHFYNLTAQAEQEEEEEEEEIIP